MIPSTIHGDRTLASIGNCNWNSDEWHQSMYVYYEQYVAYGFFLFILLLLLLLLLLSSSMVVVVEYTG